MRTQSRGHGTQSQSYSVTYFGPAPNSGLPAPVSEEMRAGVPQAALAIAREAHVEGAQFALARIALLAREQVGDAGQHQFLVQSLDAHHPRRNGHDRAGDAAQAHAAGQDGDEFPVAHHLGACEPHRAHQHQPEQVVEKLDQARIVETQGLSRRMSEDDTIDPADGGKLIAAEYVLGVLGAEERREVERRLAQEPALVNELIAGREADGVCIHCNRCMPTIYTGTRCVVLDPV